MAAPPTNGFKIPEKIIEVKIYVRLVYKIYVWSDSLLKYCLLITYVPEDTLSRISWDKCKGF